MTPDDVAPAERGATRRALRARRRTSGTSTSTALPFSDTADAAPAVVVDHDVDEEEAAVEAETHEETTGEGAAPTPLAPEDAPENVPEDAPEDEPDEALRDGLQALVDVDEEQTAPVAEWADADRPATALTWLETADVEESTRPPDLNAVTIVDSTPSLLADMRRRPALLTARWLAPLGTLAAFVCAYAVTMLVWPLHAVPPVVTAVEFETVPAAAAEITWPSGGGSGVGIGGVSSLASTADAGSIASITKVVSSLMVLDQLPLQVGEQGPEFAFSYGDSVEYWDYLRSNQSALDVPVDGVLTEYQLLQGTLLGSANNYIDRLARELWGTDEQFASAASAWLAERGLSDIRIVTPSGFDEGNTATPEALLQLAERAMQNPVFAEIVGSKGAEIPGVGYVENTNGMLADPGVVGIKTGTLTGWSLLTAKDVTVGETTLQLYASVLNQPNNDARLAATRSLFTQVETALQAIAPAVPEGTVVGEISTVWGTRVDVTVAEDVSVIVWNESNATAAVEFALDDQRDEGDAIGTVTVNGPVDAATADVALAADVDGPGAWWRLTHPLELLGVTAK